MRPRKSLMNGKNWLALVALACIASGAKAQNPNGPPATPFTLPFNNFDWLTDRGQNTYFGTNNLASNPPVYGINANGMRPGYNDPNLVGNSPGPAIFRWTFPFNYELPSYTGNPTGTTAQVPVTVDNPNPSYLNKLYTDPASYQGLAHSYLLPANTWTIPTGDNEAGIGGYALPGTTAADGYYGDYAYITAVHNDFKVSRPNLLDSPATDAELAALPNAAAPVYAAVNSALIQNATTVAVWSSGPLAAGRYSIRLYSPGAGYTVNPNDVLPIVNPNVSRAFVRVSWGPNTTPGGAPDPATLSTVGSPLNSLTTSRIFEIDPQTQGWIPLSAGGFSNSATFPCDGSNNDQIVVTLYSLTPDNVTSTVFNGRPPTITADAVQFTLQQPVTPAPGLTLKKPDGTPLLAADGTAIAISPTGRILAPPVGTGKLTQLYTGNGAVTPAGPLTYFVREEYTPDTITRSYNDPTNANSGEISDPTSSGGTVPVFYCIDNKNQNVGYTTTGAISANLFTGLGGTTDTQITSAQKVVWRFVADSDDSTGTAYASPVLANVRCRDGVIRSMIFFTTTSGTGRSHIYALDPVGDLATHSTHAYWEYPSSSVRGNANDPNIQGVTPGADYTALLGFPTKVDDQSFAGIVNPTGGINRLYDDYFSPYTTSAYFAKPDPKRRIPFAGVKGTPLLIDDPDNPTGPQLLVVPSLDGHLYAFDAGGRGDYGTLPNGSYASGTTQRLWTWPRLAADREYFLYSLGGHQNPPAAKNLADPPILTAGDSPLPNQNIIEQFSSSPTIYDAASPRSPIVIGSDYGHLYTLSAVHEDFTRTIGVNPVLSADTRLRWSFPHEAKGLNPKTPLGAISAVTVYQRGAGFKDQYVFTAGGRVYSVYATDDNNNLAIIGQLAWAYPNPTTLNNNNAALYDPAVADPNDGLTTPLDVDFNAAPLVLKGLDFYPDAQGASLGTQATNVDICYALNGSGVLYALNAQPINTTTHTTRLYATNNATTGFYALGNTESSPIAARITPEPAYYTVKDGDISPIAIVFSDLDGHIFGFKAKPELPPDPTEGLTDDVNTLSLIWEHRSQEVRLPGAARSSSAALVGGDTYNAVNSPNGNALLLQGDENGVLYCFSFGDGVDGRTPTIPKIQTDLDIGAGDVSIDIRGVNIFSQANFNGFDQTGSAGVGGAPGVSGRPNTLSPFTTNALRGNLGSTATTAARAFEWGDSVYVAAWGVYHAQPTNTVDPISEFGTAPPQITVTFIVRTGTGRSAPVTTTVTLPGVLPNTAVNGYEISGNSPMKLMWPGDVKYYNSGGTLSIYGIDPNDPKALWNKRDSDGNLINDPATGLPYQPKETILTKAYNGNVIPWEAVLRLTGPQANALQIIPGPGHPYTPGAAGIGITAYAHISQTTAHHPYDKDKKTYDVAKIIPGSDVQNQTPAFVVGEIDPDGAGVDPTRNQDGKPPTGRQLYIAHPMALTTRGIEGTPGGAAFSAGSGVFSATNYNVMGWSADLTRLPTPGDVLGNGNRTVTDVVKGTAVLKPIFAPMGSIENNTTGTYFGLTANGLVPALYAADRSNYTRATGKRLPVKAALTPLGWHGGPTSVMNPLPWEQIPIEGIGSPDYPNLGSDRVRLTKATGEDLLSYSDSNPPALDPPSYTGVARDEDGYLHGIIVPTELTLAVNVPKYFPANLNFGAGGGIGAPFKDPVSGVIYGDPTQASAFPNILGPLDNNSGLMVGQANEYANPSGGFVGNINIAVGGGDLPSATLRQQQFILGTNTASTSSIPAPYRSLTIGAGVLPTLKMRIDEQTIDLGKLSHSGGFSDANSNVPGGLNAPFYPNFVAPNLTAAQQAYYASLTRIYFRPFTLYNESNVNLIDVRMEKLTSLNGNTTIDVPSLSNGYVAGYAHAIQIRGNGINDYNVNPLFALGFGGANGGVGNIGIVSSVDHDSDNNKGTTRSYREVTAGYPLNNSYVLGANVTDWNSVTTTMTDPTLLPNSQLIPLSVNNASAASGAIYNWLDGKQPQPTIHKARPGDGVGTIMTVPDAPYGRTTTEPRPMIGIAVPLGTPVGTYTATIRAFEDSTPIQLRIWRKYHSANLPGYVADHDGIMNATAQNYPNGPYTPEEARTDPALNLRFNVVETRLTNGASGGTLGAIDPINDPLLATYPGSPNYKSSLSLGSNLLPAAIAIPGNSSEKIALFMTTNRQPTNSNNVNSTTDTPKVTAPWFLSYSTLNLPFTASKGFNFYDAAFAISGTKNYDNTGQWWTQPQLFGGTSAAIANRFPSKPGVTVNGVLQPYLPGNAVAETERHGSPALVTDGSQTFVFWQGTVDKVPALANLAAQPTQIRDSRTFYQTVVFDANGQLVTTNTPTNSFLNDPALAKFSPKPLIVTLDTGQKMLFLFWHTGGRGQTALYYNVNTTAGFPSDGWSRDQKLPVPAGVAWQSDPSPMFRLQIPVTDVTAGTQTDRDCIDVVYTGVLRNRANSETLLSRYTIVVDGGKISLQPVTLPAVLREPMARIGGTTNYESRDASWYVGLTNGTVRLEYSRNGGALTNLLQNPVGRFDAASGLTYYNSTLGGQVVVDARTGRVSFPNVTLNRATDTLYASYLPQVMRVSVNRDDTGSTAGVFTPVRTTAANTYSPVVFLDRSPNPRNKNAALDRMWVFYRKSDPTAGSLGSSVYYKTMRLMVRIPNYKPGTPISAPKASETDNVRGLAFYTQDFEGDQDTVNGAVCTVAWRDEVGTVNDKGVWSSVADTALPTDSQVNEGQVSAFKDLYQDKVWVFWTSQRNGMSDLYYETISPQFYPFQLTQ